MHHFRAFTFSLPTFSQYVLHLLLIQYFLFSVVVWAKSKRDGIHEYVHRHSSMHKLSKAEPTSRHLDLPRKPLPTNLFPGKARKLKCGSYFPVYTESPIYFNINSPGETCFHGFLGSKTAACTVAILCESKLAFSPTECKDGYILLYDGTIGFMKGCDKKCDFKMTPRYARNGGKDLYLTVKGSGGDATCVAFCKEDLAQDHFDNGIKEPKVIKKNQFKPLYKTDSSCKCGKRRAQGGRIVGGEESLPFEFPWLGGFVVNFDSRDNRKPLCGGSLITDRHVVTAAHCLDLDWNYYEPQDFDILMHAHIVDFYVAHSQTGQEDEYRKIPGYGRPNESDQSEHSIRKTIKSYTIHPLFNKIYFDWDVAILTLSSPVDFSSGLVMPVCLPEIGDFSEYPSKTKHTVAGWGMYSESAPAGSRIVQKLDVELGKCQQWWGGAPRHICAGYLKGGLDACQGDSGGPLMYKFNSEQDLLSGIVSAGTGCAREGKLGLYTNVKEVVQWIYYQIGKANGDAQVCKV